jgi:hypothetical protein
LIGGPPFGQALALPSTSTPFAQRPSTQPFPAAQAVPHSPQFALSFCKSVQAWLHAASPGKHSPVQAPAEHTSPSAQALPQPPQFFGSTLVAMHSPSQRSLYSGQLALGSPLLPASLASAPALAEPPPRLRSLPLVPALAECAALPAAPASLAPPPSLLPQDSGAAATATRNATTGHARIEPFAISFSSSPD